MSLTALHAEIMLAHDIVQWVHWHIEGDGYMSLHKDIAQPIYELLQDERDDIGELAIQHGEPAAVPGGLNGDVETWQDASFKARDAIFTIGAALDRLIGIIVAVADEYKADLGIQNHLGQLHEDLTKWRDYHLFRYISGLPGTK